MDMHTTIPERTALCSHIIMVRHISNGGLHIQSNSKWKKYEVCHRIFSEINKKRGV